MSKEMSNLLLLGVGGGGGRLATAIRTLYPGDMQVLCMDTDETANREIQRNADINCLLFGIDRLSGNGTRGDPMAGHDVYCDEFSDGPRTTRDPATGRETSRQNLLLLDIYLSETRTAVVLTCLGGGTGGGATPELLQTLQKKGIATFCIATHPFRCEGPSRQIEADRMSPQIKLHADALADIRLDDLFDETAEPTVSGAIEAANRMLASAVTLLWRLLSRPEFIHVDPERLHNLIMNGGGVRFGTAAASGNDRAAQLAGALRRSRLLRVGETANKAKALLVGILGGADLSVAEVNGIMADLRGWYPPGCHIEMGVVIDPAFDGRTEVIVFAFENYAPDLPDPEFAMPSKPAKGAKKTAGGKTPESDRPQNAKPAMGDDRYDEPTFTRRRIRLER